MSTTAASRPAGQRSRATRPSTRWCSIAGARTIPTVWDRYQAQQPQCKFGKDGVCCRLCYMGPCRITPKAPRGVCGADADTIVARNLLREVAGGTAAHSDHGRTWCAAQESGARQGRHYRIADQRRLRDAARFFEHQRWTAGRTSQIAGDLADLFMAGVRLVRGAEPAPCNSRRRSARALEEAGHRALGIDSRSWSCCTARTWAWTTTTATCSCTPEVQPGRRLGRSPASPPSSPTSCSAPPPVRSKANLGVLAADKVNIIVHGHEPALSEMLARGLAATRRSSPTPRARAGLHPRRHLLHGQRDPHSPRHPGRRQLPPAGTGDHHRRGGDDDHRRAVLHAELAQVAKCFHTEWSPPPRSPRPSGPTRSPSTKSTATSTPAA